MKKRLSCVILIALLIATASGCAPKSRAPENRYLELSSGEKIQMFLLNPTEKGVEDFTKRCDKLRPDTALGNVFNVTPLEYVALYDFQIFREDHNNACFMLFDGEIYIIGKGFGSSGVTSFALADVDGDGSDELYYAFTWGSGMIRSMIGCFDFGTKTTYSFDLESFAEGLAVGIDSKGAVVVCTADVFGLYISKPEDVPEIKLKKVVATVSFAFDQIILDYSDPEWHENCMSWMGIYLPEETSSEASE